MAKLKLTIITGGNSSERDISLVTAGLVQKNLNPDKYEIAVVDSLNRYAIVGLSTLRPDLVFVAQHGKGGEDGAIQGFLDSINVLYTGSGVLASALAMDKARCKRFVESYGVRVPKGVVVRGPELSRPQVNLPYPLIVKPNTAGSSDGVSKVESEHQLIGSLWTASAFDETILIEEYIPGMELTCAILGNNKLETLPLIEIIPAKGAYDREAKYTPGATEEICPARLPADVAERAREMARTCHLALGCKGMSRTDMRVTPEGEVVFLEINTVPGMTPTSLLPRAAQEAGYTFSKMLDRIIQYALYGDDDQ